MSHPWWCSPYSSALKINTCHLSHISKAIWNGDFCLFKVARFKALVTLNCEDARLYFINVPALLGESLLGESCNLNRRLSGEVGQDREQGGLMLKTMVFGIQGSWTRTVRLVFLEHSTLDSQVTHYLEASVFLNSEMGISLPTVWSTTYIQVYTCIGNGCIIINPDSWLRHKKVGNAIIFVIIKFWNDNNSACKGSC